MSEHAPSASELASLAAVCLWLVPFVFGTRLRLGASAGGRNWVSIAAGISIAYVFMDLLPQMSRMQELFSTAAVDRDLPFPAFRVYSSALVGFMLFYVLENMVVFARARREEDAAPLDACAVGDEECAQLVRHVASVGQHVQIELHPARRREARFGVLHEVFPFLHAPV